MRAAHFQYCHNHLKTISFEEKTSTRSGTNVHYLPDSCQVTTWSRRQMTCWVGSSHSSYHPAKFVDLTPCESKDKIFLICHVTTWSILEKSYTKWGGETIPKPFSQKSKLGISLDLKSKVLHSLLQFYVRLRTLYKYTEIYLN